MIFFPNAHCQDIDQYVTFKNLNTVKNNFEEYFLTQIIESLEFNSVEISPLSLTVAMI